MLAVFVSGCTSKPEQVADSSEITIGHPILRISLPIFVAKEKGFFEKQGLKVNLKSYETAQPMMDALVTGNLDAGGYCALPITFGAMGRTKSQLVFLTAMMEDEANPISVLIVKKDAGIKTIKDLEGKRVGILPTRAYEVWLQKVIAANGADPAKVIIQQVPPPQQADALASGSVQALFTNDPAATAAIVKGAGEQLETALVPKATGLNPFYFGSFNVTQKFANERPETVKKIAAALDEAILFIRNNQAEAKEIMKKYLPEAQRGLVDKFPSSSYLTTKETKNEDLLKLRDFYVNEKVLTIDLDLSKGQYQGN